MITRKTRLGHNTDLIIFDSLDCSLSVKRGSLERFTRRGILEEDGS